jgi:hypothetical protein
VQLAKTILGMANCGGGTIILGVDQKEDGSFEAVGLNKLTDKSKIKVQRYLPNELKLLYNLVDFHCKSSDGSVVAGKKFQAAIIKDEPLHIPHPAEAGADEIKPGDIYARRLSETVKANAVEIDKMLSRRILAMGEQEQNRQELRSLQYPNISAANKKVLRGALYDEIITAAEKIELVQYGACITVKTDKTGHYLKSNDKLRHIAPIKFPVHESIEPLSYSQLEDKKDVEDIYEDLETDRRGLQTFSETAFGSEEVAKRQIAGLRQRFGEQTAGRISRLLEEPRSFLPQLDNWTDLKIRWNKVQGEFSGKFPCSAQDPFDKIAHGIEKKQDAIRKKRERRIEFLKSVYDCLHRSKKDAIFITSINPMQTYPVIKYYGFSVDEIGEFVDYYKNKGCIEAKPVWGTKIPLTIVLTDLGIEYVESFFLSDL